jgi:FKBP-type peptidyl-prolyl cis-trans isomerase FklB
MKRILSTVILSSSLLLSMAQVKKSPAQPAAAASATKLLKTGIDSFSYAMGVQVAGYFKSQGATEVNPQMVAKAFEDVFKNKQTVMSTDMCNQTVQQKLQQFISQKSEAEKMKGAKFLAENKKKAGVIELPSGLQYQVITMGTGEKPVDGQNVKVHYHGTLIDGTVFDSSVERGEPITLGVNQVIAGWTEALKLMPVGSKWKLFIPSNLAYGDRGAGAKIPGGATLIFDVELIEIVK